MTNMTQGMNIREQMEADSFRRAASLSPAEKVRLALELSNLILQINYAVQRNTHERSKKRAKRVRGAFKKS